MARFSRLDTTTRLVDAIAALLLEAFMAATAPGDRRVRVGGW
jgi:hypothetical protein